MTTKTPTYEDTRRAWRNIWTETDFDRELQTLSYRRSQELINAYLSYLDKSTPILEAGCGLGQLVYYLRQRGYNAIGVDYAPEALTPTHERFPEMPLHVGDVHHLPYPEDYFGGYLSFGVVEHFEQGPLPALREAHRVLRPDGTLVLTVPHPNFVESLRDTLNFLFPSRLEQVGRRAEYYESTYHHDRLTSLVSSAGFEIKAVIPYSHSYTFYGLGGAFRGSGYYTTSPLAEMAGTVGRLTMPWTTAFASLIIARK